MNKIANGINEFFQWDLNRTMEITDKSITAVHYKKFSGSELYECDVKQDGDKTYVEIPNILFTTTEKFTAYLYCNNIYTKQSIGFTIIPRPKPIDYVYTETEARVLKEVIDEALLEALKDETFRGPKGDKGDKGDRGDKGEKGEKGEKGNTGATGPKGANGKDYVLTEADKNEIASIMLTNFIDVSEVGQ